MDKGKPGGQLLRVRILIFAAGVLTALLGIAAYHKSGDHRLLQGGLTLGGGWVICGLFSLNAKWHGIAGAGLLALLGAARGLPALLKLGGGGAGVFFEAAVAAISVVVFLAAGRALRVERNRRQIEALKNGEDPPR